MSRILMLGLALRTAAMISCVVPCGSPQNTASSLLQSTFSHSTSFGRSSMKKMRKHVAHGLAGMGVGGERGDLAIRMPRQQAHRVGSGVAGRAENADPLLRTHQAFLLLLGKAQHQS